MRIGVDAHYASGPYQGILTYLRELYAALATASHPHEIVFFLPEHCPPGTVKEWSALGDVVRVPEGNRLARQVTGLAAVARRTAVDALHAQTVAPLRAPCKTIVTIHDVLYLTHPQFFSAAFRLQLRWALRRTVKRADLLLAVSRYTLDTLGSRFGTTDKAFLVPNGVDHERFNVGEQGQARHRLADKYGLKRDFVLTVGRIDVRKNHRALIEAYRQATATIGKDRSDAMVPDLVIVGQPAYGSARVLEAGEALLRDGRLKILSEVPTADLPDFYRACTVFAFPSLAEGFGIPPLEAMACGAPVVACDTTAVKEVVGQAGVLVDPERPADLAEALTRMLADSHLRKRYASAGLARSADFSWERTAAAFLHALTHLEQGGKA